MCVKSGDELKKLLFTLLKTKQNKKTFADITQFGHFYVNRGNAYQRFHAVRNIWDVYN